MVEALATLAWEGRRASFFRGELMAALKILDHGDVAPGAMTGSYAGAMGQPQFMPTSYLRYAVDFEGHGRRDIWASRPDVLGSIANYLGAVGLAGRAELGPGRYGAGGHDGAGTRNETAAFGVGSRRRAAVWPAAGRQPRTRRLGWSRRTAQGGEIFAVFSNFAAIRRYNPSDFYAIAVGLIGDQVTDVTVDSPHTRLPRRP